MTSGNETEVLAIIPVRGRDVEANGAPALLRGKPLLAYTIRAALESSVAGRTIVTTDSPTVRDLAIEMGAEAPVLRPAELAAAGVTLDRVLQNCLLWLEQHEGFSSEVVISLEVSHPLRPPDLLRQVVEMLKEHQMDTIFTAYEEHHAYWRVDEYGQPAPVNSDHTRPRSELNPLYREMAGLALACKASLIREGRRFGDRVGMVPVREPYALVDTQDPLGLVLAEYLLDQGWGQLTTSGNQISL